MVHSTSAEAQQSAIAVAKGGLETVFSDVTLRLVYVINLTCIYILNDDLHYVSVFYFYTVWIK